MTFLVAMAGGNSANAQPTEIDELFDRVCHAILTPLARCDSATCRRADPCKNCAQMQRGQEDIRQLVNRLQERVGDWDVVGPRILAMLNHSEDQSLARGILALGAYAPSDAAFSWMEKCFAMAPASFSEDLQISLTDKGSVFFRNRVRVLAANGAVRPAAYLLLKGDEASIGILKAAIRENENPTDLVIAGSALRTSGDTSSWVRMKAHFERHVSELMEQGRLASARRKTLAMEYLIRAFGAHSPRNYSTGGWWGFDIHAPTLLIMTGSQDQLATEIRYYTLANARWNPDAKAILQRLQSLHK